VLFNNENFSLQKINAIKINIFDKFFIAALYVKSLDSFAKAMPHARKTINDSKVQNK
jgi:hypothetical protein